MSRSVSYGIFLTLAVAALIPSRAIGQDCGLSCGRCAIGAWEGRGYSANGSYNMDCFALLPYCVACPKIEMAAEHTPAVADIVRELRTSTNATIALVANRYRDRLLIVPERGLLVIRGTECNPDALASVVFLERAKLEALAASGVGSLADHLKSTAQ